MTDERADQLRKEAAGRQRLTDKVHDMEQRARSPAECRRLALRFANLAARYQPVIDEINAAVTRLTNDTQRPEDFGEGDT